MERKAEWEMIAFREYLSKSHDSIMPCILTISSIDFQFMSRIKLGFFMFASVSETSDYD